MRKTALDPSSSPAAAFGVQLRRSREAKGLTQKELGLLIQFSNSFVSCVERATRNPTHAFATEADAKLQTGGTLELMWWNLAHTGLIEGFPEYAALEAKAVRIRLFKLGVVPGLLQTAEYAATIAAAEVKRGSITQDQADERLAFLAARQGLLTRSPAPHVHAVLCESCFRPLGSPGVMARQFDHLEVLAARAGVTFQVAPSAIGETRPFDLPVTLLTLPDRSVVGYTEALKRGFLERDSDTVSGWGRDYDLLQVEALAQAASLALIRKARKEVLS